MNPLPNNQPPSYPYQHPPALNPVHQNARPYEQPIQATAHQNRPGSQTQFRPQNTSSATQPHMHHPSAPHPPMYHQTSPSQPRPYGGIDGNSGVYPQQAYPTNTKSPVQNTSGQQTYYDPQQNSSHSNYFQPSFPNQNIPQYDQGLAYKSNPSTGAGWNAGPGGASQTGHQMNPGGTSSFSLPFGSTSITAQALTAIVGSQTLKQEEMSRLVSWPVMKLRPYFQVTNSYVSKKLSILLFPFGHKSWQRIQASSGSQMAMPGSVPVYSAGGPSGSDSSTCTSVPVLYALPKEDNNAPDLYIPTMAFVTYVVLVGIISGMDGKFQPDVLGVTASSAFVMSLIELLIIKLGCYLLSFGNEVALLDVLAYVGYKYVGLDLTLLAGLAYPGLGAICVWLYTGLAFALFLLRSLRHAILPDSTSGFYHEQRRKRIHFLLIIAALQLVFSYFLIVEPAATPSLIKPPPLADEIPPTHPSYASGGGNKRKGSKPKTKKPSSPILPDENEASIPDEDESVKVKAERRK